MDDCFIWLSVGVCVGSEVGVAVAFGVAVALGVGVGVAVGFGVGVAVGVGVGVGVGVAVGSSIVFVNFKVSMYTLPAEYPELVIHPRFSTLGG